MELLCVVRVLVFLWLSSAPGDVLLSDNGQGWEPRHVVTSPPERERERERERTGWSARVFQMSVRGCYVTQADYITIRPNIVKQLTNNNSSQHCSEVIIIQ